MDVAHHNYIMYIQSTLQWLQGAFGVSFYK